MTISKEKIREFQRIYKEVFGIEISETEAQIKGATLLRIIYVISKPKIKSPEMPISK